jgi:hypothetical protein
VAKQAIQGRTTKVGRLEELTNVVVLIVALGVGGTLAYDRLRPTPSRTGDTIAAKLVGNHLTLPGPGKAKETVALFVSSTCRFCTASMGFYRKLAALRNDQCSFRLVALGPKDAETDTEFQHYLGSNGLKVDSSGVVEFSAFSIQATPTIAIGDSSNMIRHTWVGSLNEEPEDEVISKIQSSCGA